MLLSWTNSKQKVNSRVSQRTQKATPSTGNPSRKLSFRCYVLSHFQEEIPIFPGIRCYVKKVIRLMKEPALLASM